MRKQDSSSVQTRWTQFWMKSLDEIKERARERIKRSWRIEEQETNAIVWIKDR